MQSGAMRRKLQHRTPLNDVLHLSEVERLRRDLKDMRATCAVGQRRLNATEEKLLESTLDSVEGLSGQLATQRHEAAQLRQVPVGGGGWVVMVLAVVVVVVVVVVGGSGSGGGGW